MYVLCVYLGNDYYFREEVLRLHDFPFVPIPKSYKYIVRYKRGYRAKHISTYFDHNVIIFYEEDESEFQI